MTYYHPRFHFITHQLITSESFIVSVTDLIAYCENIEKIRNMLLNYWNWGFLCFSFQNFPVNFTLGWSDWSRYGECSVSCGGGLQEERRTCLSVPDDCLGSSLNFLQCNTQKCSGKRSCQVYCTVQSLVFLLLVCLFHLVPLSATGGITSGALTLNDERVLGKLF